jgi:hypothetical protein
MSVKMMAGMRSLLRGDRWNPRAQVAVHLPVRLGVRGSWARMSGKSAERDRVSGSAIPTPHDPLSSLQDGSISPATLEQLERLHPGSAERVLKMAETQQAHRIEQERALLAARITQRQLGQWVAATAAVGGIVAAVLTAHLGGPGPLVPLALVGVSILGIVQTLRIARE